MATIDEVLKEWKEDSIIDELQINKELLKSPMLHAKYLEYFMSFKAKLAIAERKYNKMSFTRKRYYRGELTKDELDQYGWDQYQGLKMSNTEYNQHSNIDPILVDMKELVDSHKASVQCIEFIMKNIAGRDWAIKSLIEHNKFVAGI